MSYQLFTNAPQTIRVRLWDSGIVEASVRPAGEGPWGASIILAPEPEEADDRQPQPPVSSDSGPRALRPGERIVDGEVAYSSDWLTPPAQLSGDQLAAVRQRRMALETLHHGARSAAHGELFRPTSER